MNADTVPGEAAARRELAACYRLFALLGWTELIYNHITLRLPDGSFLINRFGLHYSEVCASNLIRVDASGAVVGAAANAVNPAGYMLHTALHQGIPEAHAIMHTHTTAGMAVASSEAGLAMTNFYAVQLSGRVAYHDFEGITLYPEEGQRLLQAIGSRQAVILRNHGLLSWGRNLAEAFAYLWTLNRACEVQVAGAALGPARAIDAAIQEKCARDSLQFDPRFGAGRDVFDALVRRVDRIDPDYRN